MTLRMLKTQPRNVIAKLNGFTSAKKQEFFDRLTPEQYEADGRHLYWIAESRPRTAEIRKAGPSAAKIVADTVRQGGVRAVRVNRRAVEGVASRSMCVCVLLLL